MSDLARIEEPKTVNFESVSSQKQEAVVSIIIIIVWYGGELKKGSGFSF